jgi:TonB-linked SusC/RagA family outer membrane protein
MFKKLLAVAFVVLLAPIAAFAQNASISGRVTDASNGDAIIGANIYVVQLERGAVSDLEGNYSVTGIAPGTYTVNVSYIGYRPVTQQVTLSSGQNFTLNVQMQLSTIGLEEFVVSGYGVTQKRELTGSIASVRSQDIQGVALQSTEGLLQGRAAGVTVTTTSGNPGGAFQVKIRGNGSVNAATEPLYVIDGVQVSFAQLSSNASTTPLNALNPNDIESIEVLKDAAASAIYGAQAAAGVVLITTKQGRAGRTIVNASVERGVRSLARNVEYISSEEYVDYMAEGLAYRNGVRQIDGTDMTPFQTTYRNFLITRHGEDPNLPAGSGQLANYNWQDLIFSEGATAKYTMSFSGGSQNTSYYVSGGYEDTEGTAFNTDFTRLSLRTNFDHKINNRLDVSMRTGLSRSTQFGVCQDGNFVNCPPSQAMFLPPMAFPYNADGTPSRRLGIVSPENNPVIQISDVDRDVTVTQILSSLALNYRFNDWISARGSVSIDYRNTNDNQYRSPVAAPVQRGLISFANRNVQNVMGNFVVNFDRDITEEHNIAGLFGTEYRRDYSESQVVQGEGFPGPFFKVLSATANPTAAAGTYGEWKLGSYFTNLRYNYNEKYFVNLVGRYDGHSRFGSGNRWAFFPSVSLAWRISEENFFTFDAVDELKLRVSYGITGNSAIGNYAARGLFSVSGSYQGVTGLTASQLANNALSWEEAREFNVGLDFEILEGRIFGALDYYTRDNENLLFGRPLPSDSGFGSILENIGAIRNSGVELELNSVNLNTRGFQWSTRFNVAMASNEILELPDGNDIRPNGAFDALIIGQALGIIQVPRWAGVNPADGRPMWYDAEGNITYTPEASDAINYKDGNAEYVGGFGNTFSYKGLTLDAFFQFNLGQWAFPSTDYYFTRTPDFLMNMTKETLDRWRNPGDITYYPRAINAGTDYAETDDYRVEVGTQSIYNASYIRLKNVSLSYQLPSSLTERVGMGSVRLYASAVNLITWTAWPFYDPEVAFSPNDIYNNVTTASYPTERQIYAGIDIRF